MFNPDNNYEKFENKVWLSSPTMYPDSMRYVMEAYVPTGSWRAESTLYQRTG